MPNKNPFYADKIILSGRSGSGIFGADGTSIVDENYNVDAEITTSDLTTTGDTTLGNASTDTLTVPSTSQFNAPITVGVDDTGYDVKLFGATSGAYLLWDESADQLVLAGTATVQLAGKLNFGLNGGAASASGILAGVGTTANPATTASADAKFIELRTQSSATSGDSRGLYWRHELTGAGVSGETIRAFTKLSSAAATVRGAHISLDVNTSGSASVLGS